TSPISTPVRASPRGLATSCRTTDARSASRAVPANRSIEAGCRRVMSRLRENYEKGGKPALMKEFGYKNPLQAPRLEKIVINMGIGEAVQDQKRVDAAAQELALIAGQKAVVTRAKKSIATFKLREGMAIGAKVTLRKERMYEFLDRLITVALPR